MPGALKCMIDYPRSGTVILSYQNVNKVKYISKRQFVLTLLTKDFSGQTASRDLLIVLNHINEIFSRQLSASAFILYDDTSGLLLIERDSEVSISGRRVSPNGHSPRSPSPKLTSPSIAWRPS